MQKLGVPFMTEIFKKVLKLLKGLILFTTITLVLSIVFRGPLFRWGFSYSSVQTREITRLNAESSKYFSERDCGDLIEAKIQKNLKIVGKTLEYTFKSVSSNPNSFRNYSKAHCVGYSALFASLLREDIECSGISKIWAVQHGVGKIHLFGFNLHSLFNSPFFRDHDFVILENMDSGEVIKIDPVVYDYLFIETVN